MDSPHKAKPGRPRKDTTPQKSPDLKTFYSSEGGRPVRGTRVAALTCQTCGKTFNSVAARYRHNHIHSGDRPYACGFCGEQFRRTDELYKHETKHEGGDNYCCYICESVLENQEELVKHMKTHSIDIVPHVSSAGYTFRSSAVVKRYHELYQSGQSQPCYVCFEECPSPEELLNHLTCHTALELIKGSTDRSLWRASVTYAEDEYSKWRSRRSKMLTKASKDKLHKGHDTSGYTHVCRVCHQMFKGVQMLFSHWMQKKGRSGHVGRVGDEGYNTHIFSLNREDGTTALKCELCENMLHTMAESVEHFHSHYKECESQQAEDEQPKECESQQAENEQPKECELQQAEDEQPKDDSAAVENDSEDVSGIADNENNSADVSADTEDETNNTQDDLMDTELDGSDTDHASPGKAVCPICNKTLKTSKLLRHHLSMHKGEKSFLCPVCGKLYSRPEDLKQHIVRHVSQKYREGNAVDVDSMFSCDICPEVFASEKDLQFHGVFHGVYRPGTKTYTEGHSTMCPICGKMLQKATSLVSHIKLHDQERDFKCRVCGRAFRSERNKERHEKIHSGVKDFTCEICGKGLSRKAEYVAHVRRHGTDPTFNGKAGRKKGTKVIDNKVVLIKDIYKPQETKDFKPKTRLPRKRLIRLEGTDQFFLPVESDHVTSSQRQTLVCYPEKTIIPYKNRKMKYELVTIDDYSEGAEPVPSQSVETQTDAPEQSLAHNIEIIDSELRCIDNETVVVAPEHVTEGEAGVDTSVADDDAIIVIVQDPTTGENEVLTIKSFQEGASKLISPNEELIKALESFQKNKTMDEEVVTLSADAGVDAGNIQIKTEKDETTVSVPDIQVKTETNDCASHQIKTEIDESTDVSATTQNSSVLQSCPETVNQRSLLLTSATHGGMQEDRFRVPPQDNRMEGGLADITSQACEPSTPDDLHASSQIPVNKNVKVVSFTLDEATGLLVPVYPDDDAAIPIPQTSGGGAFCNIADAAGWTGDGPVSVLLDAEGDRTAVEALMQMKSPEHHRVLPLMNISGSGDHLPVTSPPPAQSTSPGGQVMSPVCLGSTPATLLKCTPDGRVLRTPSGAPAVFESTPVKLSPSPSKNRVKVLPVHPSTVDNSAITKPEPDYQKITGDVVNVPDAEMDGDDNSVVDVHDDCDDDSGLHDDGDDEPDYEPVKKRRKSKKDLSPVQPVRKSLRKHSYEGVSKIVASLIRPKRKVGVKHISKSDPDSTEEEIPASKPKDTAADTEVKEFSPEFVKCNICKQLLDREKLKEHIDIKHGRSGYKCGLCGQGYENNIDLHMHLLGHEKADRVKKTLLLFSEDMESNKHQLEAQGSSVLGVAASAAILALERGGDLQEALATVDVDVDEMLLETATQGVKTQTKSGAGNNAVQTSPQKTEDPPSGRRSSPRIKANLKTKQTKEDKTSTTENSAVVDMSSSADTSGSTAATNPGNNKIDSVEVPTEAGDCAACRDSFMSSFHLQKQDQAETMRKQHTCDKTRSDDDGVEAVQVDAVPAADDDDFTSKEVLPCVCGLCGYSFINVNLLTRHVKAHYQEKPFACNLCHKKYARRDELTKHRLTHQKTVVDKPKPGRRKFLPRSKNGTFPCHLCKETFKTYQNRYTHVLCHENSNTSNPDKTDKIPEVPENNEAAQKPSGDKSDLTCDVCGLVLSGTRHLERHKLVHTGERPWLCQNCGKSFLRNDDLRVHRKRQHSQENPVAPSEDSEKITFHKKCPFCNKTFTSFGSFRNHVKTHKSEKLDGSLKCDICGKVFIKHISLRNHKQKHGDTYRRGMKRNIRKGEHAPSVYFNCEKCGTRIKNKSNFLRHMKLHNEGKDLFCQHCRKGFARSADLKMHERLHTGERPFLCNICGKGFTSNSALGHHVKLHDQPVVYKFSCTQCECLFASRKEFRTHVKTCTPKTMEIVFIEDMDTVPIETIQYIEHSPDN